MFSFFPCLNTREAVTDLATNMRDISLGFSKVHKRMKKQHKAAAASRGRGKEKAAPTNGGGTGEEEPIIAGGTTEEDGKEWVAEDEHGVLLTFVSLPHGVNRLRKIRFSEEYFDARESKRWWSDNFERIMALYCVEQTRECPTPPQSDDESLISSSKESPAKTYHDLDKSSNPPPTPNRYNAATREPSQRVVVEEQPGVFLTIHASPDGRTELVGVELSREHFGVVQARVWWVENRERLQQQYSSIRWDTC